MTRIWIDISDDQAAKLRQLAKQTGFSRSDLIRLAIRDYLLQNLASEHPAQPRLVGQDLTLQERR